MIFSKCNQAINRMPVACPHMAGIGDNQSIKQSTQSTHTTAWNYFSILCIFVWFFKSIHLLIFNDKFSFNVVTVKCGDLNCCHVFAGGCNIESEEDSWDFGTGAGFYVDATEEKWKTNYRMYSYVTKEVSAESLDAVGDLLPAELAQRHVRRLIDSVFSEGKIDWLIDWLTHTWSRSMYE